LGPKAADAVGQARPGFECRDCGMSFIESVSRNTTNLNGPVSIG
jgi:hypothetical protein